MKNKGNWKDTVFWFGAFTLMWLLIVILSMEVSGEATACLNGIYQI